MKEQAIHHCLTEQAVKNSLQMYGSEKRGRKYHARPCFPPDFQAFSKSQTKHKLKTPQQTSIFIHVHDCVEEEVIKTERKSPRYFICTADIFLLENHAKMKLFLDVVQYFCETQGASSCSSQVVTNVFLGGKKIQEKKIRKDA